MFKGITTTQYLFNILIAAMIGYAVLLPGHQRAWAGTDKSEHIIRVGIYQNAPKVYQKTDGTPAGLFVTLLKAMAAKENWQLQFIPCEWAACLKELTAGDIDLMPDVAFSQQRERLFGFHQVPVAHSWSVILVPAKERVYSISSLNNHRIAMLAGSIQRLPLKSMMAGSGLQYTPLAYKSYAEAFTAVRDGQADAVVSNSFYADLHAKQYGLHETPIVFDPATLYFATTRGDPLGLLPRIDAHLQAWRYDENSIYYKALKTAMVPAQETVVPPKLYRAIIGVGILLFMFLAMSAALRWQVRRKTALLRESGQRLDHMLHSSPVVLYQLILDGGHISTRWVSDNLERLFGFSSTEFVAKDMWSRLIHPDDHDMVLNNLAVLQTQQQLVQEYRILDSKGNVRHVRDEMRLLAGAPGQADEIVGSWNDLTESHRQAARLSFLTNYDPLTRLPNRALFLERLTQSVYRARREGRQIGLLYTDIDRFKHINESLGHTIGDIVLGSVTERFQHLLRSGDILARIGGNGFVILLENDAGQHQVLEMARAVTRSFVEPIRLRGQDIALTLSVGISLYPEHGDDALTLLQHAEAAMYEAKAAGRNLHRMYSSSHTADIDNRLILEAALRGAIARDELLLHYQPQIDLRNRELVGAEALLRWQHPKLGMVSPGQFIPLAEEMGIIGEIGAWVLETACRQMLAWRKSGLYMPRIAVNLSAQQVDDETVVPLAQEVLSRSGLDPGSLELEVTESLIMREPEKAAIALEAFRRMGIHLAIDDFGTGYSSLSYLKHLPIHRLKIDQSFVRDIGTDTNSEAISRAIIGLARSLELETIAEGIEHTNQLEFLRREGCNLGQGYLISRPISAENLAAFMRRTAQNLGNKNII